MTRKSIPDNSSFTYPTEENLRLALKVLRFTKKERKNFTIVAASLKIKFPYDRARKEYLDWLEENHSSKIYREFKNVLHAGFTPRVKTLAPLFKLAKCRGFVPLTKTEEANILDIFTPNTKAVTEDDKQQERDRVKKFKAFKDITSHLISTDGEEAARRNSYLQDKRLNLPTVKVDIVDCKKVYSDDPNSPLYYLPPFWEDDSKFILRRSHNQRDTFIVSKLYDLPSIDIVGYEIITETGKKYSHTIANSNAYGIINPFQLTSHCTIVITEGLATALSIQLYYPNKVYIFSRGKENLVACAKAVRHLRPNALIEIAGDNDMDGGGQNTAKYAAKTVGATLHIPLHVGDWNSVHVTYNHMFKKWYDIPTEWNSSQNEEGTDSTNEIITKYNIVKKTYNSVLISNKYLGDVIKDHAIDHPIIAVEAQMGAGKTVAIQCLIDSLKTDEVVIYLSPRIRLNFAMANNETLGFEVFSLNSKFEGELTRLAVTPLSLAELMERLEEQELSVKLVIFDESNECSNMLTSHINKNKLKITQALTKLCRSADNVVYMDAFLDRHTTDMINCFHAQLNYDHVTTTYSEKDGVSSGWVGDRPTAHMDYTSKPFVISSTFKPWDGYKLSILSSAPNESIPIKAIKTKLISEMYELIEKGEPIYIASMSRTFAEELKQMFTTSFPEVPLVYLAGQLQGQLTSDEKKTAEAFLTDPKRFMPAFKIIIATPAVSVGLSFYLKDYIHTTFGIVSNSSGTADPATFIQLLARVRDVKTKTFRIILGEKAEPYAYVPTKEVFLAEKTAELRRNYPKIGGDIIGATLPFLKLAADNTHDFQNNKNNFNTVMSELLKKMSAVKRFDHKVTKGWYTNATHLVELENNAKGELAKEKRELILQSKRISLNESKRLEGLAKYAKEALTQGQWGQLWRYRLEHSYMCNLTDMVEARQEVIFQMYEQNVISKIALRENVISHKQGAKIFKEVEKARKHGLGIENYYFADVLSDKHSSYDRLKLYRYPLNHIDKYNEWSSETLGKPSDNPLFQYIRRHRKQLAAAGIKRYDLKKLDLARTLHSLIKDMGYKVRSNKVREGDKTIRIFSIDPDTETEKLVRVRRELGITQPEQIASAFEQINAGVEVKDLKRMNYAEDPVPHEEKMGVVVRYLQFCNVGDMSYHFSYWAAKGIRPGDAFNEKGLKEYPGLIKIEENRKDKLIKEYDLTVQEFLTLYARLSLEEDEEWQVRMEEPQSYLDAKKLEDEFKKLKDSPEIAKKIKDAESEEKELKTGKKEP